MTNTHQRPIRLLLALLAVMLTLAALPQLSGTTPATAAPATLGLTIPTGTAPKLDGSCADFADVAPQTFTDGGGSGLLYLKVSGPTLYACIQATAGTFKDRFGSLYLDPQGDGASYTFAAKDDFALRLPASGAERSTYNGTGVANGYVTNASLAGAWDGKAVAAADGESFEYALSYGRFGIAPCTLFGLAAYHHWFAAVGDDYGWPSNTYFDQPRTWKQLRIDNGQCGGQSGRIAYVYRGETGAASSFYNLLVSAGYSVELVPLADVLTTTFRAASGAANYDLIIVADDTGDLDSWGSSAPPPDLSADQVTRLRDARLPIIGLGEGGYAFFGKLPLFIGWPQGWHGPQQRVNRAASAPAAYYNGIVGDPVTLYSAPSNAVGIYLNPAPLPADVLPIGLEDPTTDHATIIQQGCRLLWGFSADANAMSSTGQQVFINAVGYMRNFQCGTDPQPQPTCTLTKSADPASGTAVRPGQVIRYTLTYTNCTTAPARLTDTVPSNTIFVPGSATDGIAPGPDGALVWSIPASSSGSKSFKVLVSDTICNAGREFKNIATLLAGGAITESNIVRHPVDCPPITMPNDAPPYAEREISIHPYPFVTGRASAIKVQLTNSSATPQLVRVSFQTSPQRFGIGINFGTFDSRVVTIPAGGNIVVATSFTPVSSGHYCIQVKIEDASPNPRYAPIFTSRNVDVNENLTPGQPDDLVFKVANPTESAADIRLTVDNTCPGWRAEVIPALLSAVGPRGGDVRDATLRVTPPNPATLGSGCHIDVQGWIGDQLIGGIRKLDVPPVHLPREVQPPWEEPEITLVPNPPVVGQPAQICVELQNPQPSPRTITVRYAVADFGAGIPFSPVATRSFTLPANSIDRYCADWTPASGGTLHRCILITLEQPGYLPMTSQRNVDLRRIIPDRLGQLEVPFKVRNPDGVPHRLQLRLVPWGLDPRWQLRTIGDPPPEVLAAGQTVNLRLGFALAAQRGFLADTHTERVEALAQGSAWRYGDEVSARVTVLLDGVEIGGLTVRLDSGQVVLPSAYR